MKTPPAKPAPALHSLAILRSSGSSPTDESSADSSVIVQGKTGLQYWRSLEQLADTPAFRAGLHQNFVKGADEMFQKSRRRFLKMMGASLGLAGMTGAGCIRLPEEKLAPYAHRPENRIPGNPVNYATAMEILGIAQGLLVTSYDGRPIKVEGNPSHPLNKGAADTLAQASVLEMYDPDRSRGVLKRDKDQETEVGWDEFAKWAKSAFAGGGVCVLSEASSSPSLAVLKEKFASAPFKGEWFEYEPVSGDNAREGARIALGQEVLPVLELAEAKIIVSLDADLFGGGDPLAVKHARDFAAGRRMHENKSPEKEDATKEAASKKVADKEVASKEVKGPGERAINRLYVVEAVHSITGACADHRLALKPSQIEAFASALAERVGAGPAGAGVPEGTVAGESEKFLAAIAADLQACKGQAVVVAGARQPAAVHALAMAINLKLGNVGKTVICYPDPQPKRPSHAAAIAKLVKKMQAGEVSTLLIIGGNPVYNAPADLKFADALKKLKNTAHLALHDDETSQMCGWHLSRAHYLESWGDARTIDGTVSIVQPLIEPLFDGRSPIEVVALVLGEEGNKASGYEIVRQTYKTLAQGKFSEWNWKKVLGAGVVEDTAWKPVAVGEEATASPALALTPAVAKDEYEVAFLTDAKVFDGRFANNGWLQELPEPMTRLTWDNAALMSPATASNIGVKQDELITLKTGGSGDVAAAAVQVPVFFLPGMADGTIGLALGYGRKFAGNIGNKVGHNAYLLRTTAALGWCVAKVQSAGQPYQLATVQDHHIIEESNHVVKNVGRDEYERRVPILIHEVALANAYEGEVEETSDEDKKTGAISIFAEHPFDGSAIPGVDDSHIAKHDKHRWGMAVDLSTCTGCGACVVACQSENNIPIVGKEQVLHGREMHWIRIDRYYSGTPEDPKAVHQPVLCMQCENAPCESVCPVAATTHSEEGLNMMTYNRCVGTRYCSNNCPYKVRRFNFFDYNRGTKKDEYLPNQLREPISELVKMQKNPEVTVRMRGIMEKCTYCVQRIERVRITAKREGDRPIADHEIQTACQQSCPTHAIVFGDLNDPKSEVSKLHALSRTYSMLDEVLNTKPRTQYIAKVRNLVPALAKAEAKAESKEPQGGPGALGPVGSPSSTSGTGKG
jgi:molybdopterin-containing oxidoreductase family iron-sulfur binding subunit